MKSIARNRLLLIVLLVLTAIFLPACKHGSTLLSNGSGSEPIKPQPPRVSCKQPMTPKPGNAPRKDEWVFGGQLSERAANFIADVLGFGDKEQELRKKEHACLDEHEKRGDIQQ